MDTLAIELRAALKSFLANASDEEFSASLALADQGIYSRINIPIAALDANITRMESPIRYSTLISYRAFVPRRRVGLAQPVWSCYRCPYEAKPSTEPDLCVAA
jgi:hypothetical protein